MGHINHYIFDENDHSLGFVDNESRCFPETLHEPALIANEAHVRFEVEDVPYSSMPGQRLYVGQILTVQASWKLTVGGWEHVHETWNECFQMRDNVAGPDRHWDNEPFPKYCAMKCHVRAKLFLIKLKVPPGNEESDDWQFHLWRSSEHKTDEKGRATGEEKPIPPPGGGGGVSGDFRSDPNVQVIGGYGGFYSYRQEIDHCALAGQLIVQLAAGIAISEALRMLLRGSRAPGPVPGPRRRTRPIGELAPVTGVRGAVVRVMDSSQSAIWPAGGALADIDPLDARVARPVGTSGSSARIGTLSTEGGD